MKSPRTARQLAFCGAAAVLACALSEFSSERLSNHEGYYLVPVADSVGAPHVRPRHTVFILADGLTRRSAEQLEFTRKLRQRGPCARMRVGPITISRPVYSVLSTGLEQDRTGARTNSEESPLAAESVWETARRSGLSVTAVSRVSWWQQLFPRGFSRYDVLPEEVDYFAAAEPLDDLTLIHPLYVDDAGHLFGAASPEYKAATTRLDRELGKLWSRLDLQQDLVILTSDHGHMSYGGHGGQQPAVTQVLTCVAGRGVAPGSSLGALDSRTLAPLVAFLLGVPFPRHQRAFEDKLDVLFRIADHNALTPAYIADRRAAVERFRERNRTQLRRWLGNNWLGGNGPPSWARFYARQRMAQQLRLAVGLVLIGAMLSLVKHQRKIGHLAALGVLSWAAVTVAATLGTYALVRGSLDLTSINGRIGFIVEGLLVCLAVGCFAVAGHRMVFSDRHQLLGDQLTLVGLLIAAIVLHIVVYGWPLGFPLPGPEQVFLTYLAPIFLFVQAAITAMLCAKEPAG